MNYLWYQTLVVVPVERSHFVQVIAPCLLQGCAPLYISNLLILYVPVRNLCSSDKLLLFEPKSKHSWADRSFTATAPWLWNELPFFIRYSIILLLIIFKNK